MRFSRLPGSSSVVPARTAVRLLICMASSLLGLGLTPAAAVAGETHSCGNIAFQPQSENGVFDIATYRESCATGRYVAGRSRASRYRHSGAHYRARGYDCYGSTAPIIKTVIAFDCTKGDHDIQFTRG